MDIYLFKPEEYQRLYNCNFYSVELVPLEQRQHVFLGSAFVLLFFLFEFLYILCFMAIPKHLEHSCYKIMFYMGINDIACMCVCGLLTGIFGIFGTVFCSSPNLIYIGGILGCTFWYNETVCSILLALNRCLEISLPSLGRKLFGGHKTWLWLCVPFCYGLFCGSLFKSMLFSGISFSWFFNPHLGYWNDVGRIYDNPMIPANDVLVVTVFPALYLCFLTILICKYRTFSNIRNAFRSQKKIFIQVFLISTINITAVSIYVYMQFFPTSKYLIYLASTCWFFAHGLKPVIYLSLNGTIQMEVFKVICTSRYNRIMVNPTGIFTMEQKEKRKKIGINRQEMHLNLNNVK